jgi:DNA topoisomerase-1
MQVLQDRKYVLLDKKRLIPEDRGRLVTAFLMEYFKRYVEYDFTADLENKLDDISGGRIAWKKVLQDFWKDFSAAIAGTKDLNITQVIDALDEDLGAHFFPPRADGTDPRLCPICGQGRLGLKLGRFGAFIGCSKYPECRYTRPLGMENGENALANEPRSLGLDPVSGLEVTVKKGPYGPYVQLGETPPKPEKRKKGEKRAKGEKVEKVEPPPKPKRASLPKGMSPAEMTLELALKLLSLPRDVGPHPEDGEIIIANNGRFGPYIKHGKLFKSLSPDDDVLTIGLNRAVVLLAEPRKFRRGAPEPIKVLGEHPAEGGPVKIFNGKYGLYVSHDGINATLPGDIAPEALTMDRAVELLAERAEKTGKKKPKAKAKAGAAKGSRVKKTPKKKPSGTTEEAAE